jgi:hypothetical protein
MRGRSGLAGWAMWVWERKERRGREVEALKWAERSRVKWVWHVLSEGVRKRRRERGREKVRHARVLAAHRSVSRVWEGWVAHVGERRRKHEGRRVGGQWWAQGMLERWEAAVKRGRRERGRREMAALLFRQVRLVKGWGRWVVYVRAIGRRRTRGRDAALRCFRETRTRTAVGESKHGSNGRSGCVISGREGVLDRGRHG